MRHLLRVILIERRFANGWQNFITNVGEGGLFAYVPYPSAGRTYHNIQGQRLKERHSMRGIDPKTLSQDFEDCSFDQLGIS